MTCESYFRLVCALQDVNNIYNVKDILKSSGRLDEANRLQHAVEERNGCHYIKYWDVSELKR